MFESWLRVQQLTPVFLDLHNCEVFAVLHDRHLEMYLATSAWWFNGCETARALAVRTFTFMFYKLCTLMLCAFDDHM